MMHRPLSTGLRSLSERCVHYNEGREENDAITVYLACDVPYRTNFCMARPLVRGHLLLLLLSHSVVLQCHRACLTTMFSCEASIPHSCYNVML